MKALKSIDTPEYTAANDNAKDDAIIEQAIWILSRRMRQLGPAMKSPSTVKDYLTLTAPHDGREHFRVLWLDAQHRLIEAETLTVGTLTQASIYPREVVKSALAAEAAACIITHNHPSGMAEPSNADRAVTKMLKEALDLVDVRLLDHVITAGSDSMSFAEACEL